MFVVLDELLFLLDGHGIPLVFHATFPEMVSKGPLSIVAKLTLALKSSKVYEHHIHQKKQP